MLGGDDHVGDAENRVGPSGENLQVAEGVVLQFEEQCCSFATADPGFLHALGGVGPVDVLQVGEQTFGVGGDAQNPLAQVAPLDREAADFGFAVNNFLIGEDGAQFGAPPHGTFVNISEAAFEKLEEYPLRPPEILRIGRVHFAVPVVGKAEGLDLAAEVDDVVLRVGRGVRAGFHRVLLGGKAESIPADRVEDIEALGALVTGDDVGGGVTLRMPDVQTCAGRVGEHVEYVVFGLRRVVFGAE